MKTKWDDAAHDFARLAGSSLLVRLLMRLNFFSRFLYPDKSVRPIAGNATVLEFWEQVPTFVAIEATKTRK